MFDFHEKRFYGRRIAYLVILLLGYVVTSQNAQAYEATPDGQLNFSGRITNNTCIVSPDSKEFSVDLGKVASKQFVSGGGSEYKHFVIKLESCGSTVDYLTVHFNGTPDSKNSELLAITSGAAAASGIGIGIYNQDMSLIPLGDESAKFKLTPNQASASLDFYARYIGNGNAIVPGAANSSATFILTYA